MSLGQGFQDLLLTFGFIKPDGTPIDFGPFEPPVVIHNKLAGFIEYVTEDVCTVSDYVRDTGIVLLRAADDRRIVGVRIEGACSKILEALTE